MTAPRSEKRQKSDLWQRALCLLAQQGPATSTQLARQLNCQPRSLAGLLTKKVAYGLVERYRLRVGRQVNVVYAVPQQFPSPAEIVQAFGPKLPAAELPVAAVKMKKNDEADDEHRAWMAEWQARAAAKQSMRERV